MKLTKSPPGQHSVKLARSTYSGQIAASLREAIVGGELEEGAQLVEARLAEGFAVSRGPVRAALQVLEGEGLVRTLPNGRSEVAGFRSLDLRDLYDVRFEFESHALSWGFARSADTGPVVAAFEAFAEEGWASPRLVELDIELHRSIVALSGSRFLMQAWLSLAPVVVAVITTGNRSLVDTDPVSNFERIVDSHRVIVDAVVRNDLQAATRRLSEQFAWTQNLFLKNRSVHE